jgi:adenine-specific DNA-methyltransferase
VDINPNSVKICQLRLWIELLKHPYYIVGAKNISPLQTLPNIDINIKCGNSLMSRFDLADKYNEIPGLEQRVKQATKKYKEWVYLYKQCDNKEAKKQLVKNIENEKNIFYQINNAKDTDYDNLQKANVELATHTASFNFSEEYQEKTKLLTDKLIRLEKIYNDKKRGCFEWRFEFPEVLDENGNFTGFDIVMGNPPYISAPTMVDTNPKGRQAIIESNNYTTLYQKWDLYVPFMERGFQLLVPHGIFSMIVPYPLTVEKYAKVLRELIINQYNLVESVDLKGLKVFKKATVSNCIPIIIKSQTGTECYISHIDKEKQISRSFLQPYSNLLHDAKTSVWNLTSEVRDPNRHSEMNILGDFCYISKGMVLNSDEKAARREFAKKDLISDTFDAVHCRKFINAKDIERYRVKRTRYLEYNTERCPDRLSRPTFRELYEKPKLMFNRLGNLMVYFDKNTKYLHSDSMFSAVLWKDLKGIENKSISASVKRYSRYLRKEMEAYSEKIDLRYLIGILNSKYAIELLTNIRGGYINIYPEHLRNLPIPLVDKAQQQPIINLVDKIIAAKKKKTAADTRELEKEIDELVYELYGLTGRK